MLFRKADRLYLLQNKCVVRQQGHVNLVRSFLNDYTINRILLFSKGRFKVAKNKHLLTFYKKYRIFH